MTSSNPPDATVQIELQLRVNLAKTPAKLSRVLQTIKKTGACALAHLCYKLPNDEVALFLCEHASEAALALSQEGMEAGTQTAVVVRSPNRGGLLNVLMQTLEAEPVEVFYSYATSEGDRVVAVFRTNNNPLAEDVLRNYLVPAAVAGGEDSTTA